VIYVAPGAKYVSGITIGHAALIWIKFNERQSFIGHCYLTVMEYLRSTAVHPTHTGKRFGPVRVKRLLDRACNAALPYGYGRCAAPASASVISRHAIILKYSVV
jgi:GNAT superfamily N-acetyltransferase